jgi:hypothetical protein
MIPSPRVSFRPTLAKANYAEPSSCILAATQDCQRLGAARERLDHNQGTSGKEFLLMPAGFALRDAQTNESAQDPAGGRTGGGSAKYTRQESGGDDGTHAGDQTGRHRSSKSTHSSPGHRAGCSAFFDFRSRVLIVGRHHSDFIVPEPGLPQLLDETVRLMAVCRGGDHGGRLVFVSHNPALLWMIAGAGPHMSLRELRNNGMQQPCQNCP